MRTTRYLFSLMAAALLLVGAPQTSRGQVIDDATYTHILFDQLEYRPDAVGRPVSIEATGWIGGDLNRFWLRAEGEQSTLRREGETEVEALYGRFVTSFFDAVAGARLDRRWEEGRQTRGHFAVGLQGLAPYRFEVESTLYLSHEGNLSAGFAAAYPVFFTQRLILEPEVEAGAALQEVPEWGVGSGLNDLDLGVRLRYEFHRKVAPYVGYVHGWTFGQTAELVKASGEDPSHGAVVFGVRLWR